MNPDVARLLAADRHADLRRDSPATRRAPGGRRRLSLVWLRRGYYAGAPTGARTGT